MRWVRAVVHDMGNHRGLMRSIFNFGSRDSLRLVSCSFDAVMFGWVSILAFVATGFRFALFCAIAFVAVSFVSSSGCPQPWL